MNELLNLVNTGRHASKELSGSLLAKASLALILSTALSIATLAAVDTEFANQDAQVEQHKLMLAGYYDADLDDVEYEVSDKAKTAEHANDFIINAYGRR